MNKRQAKKIVKPQMKVAHTYSQREKAYHYLSRRRRRFVNREILKGIAREFSKPFWQV